MAAPGVVLAQEIKQIYFCACQLTDCPTGVFVLLAMFCHSAWEASAERSKQTRNVSL